MIKPSIFLNLRKHSRMRNFFAWWFVSKSSASVSKDRCCWYPSRLLLVSLMDCDELYRLFIPRYELCLMIGYLCDRRSRHRHAVSVLFGSSFLIFVLLHIGSGWLERAFGSLFVLADDSFSVTNSPSQMFTKLFFFFLLSSLASVCISLQGQYIYDAARIQICSSCLLPPVFSSLFRCRTRGK